MATLEQWERDPGCGVEFILRNLDANVIARLRARIVNSRDFDCYGCVAEIMRKIDAEYFGDALYARDREEAREFILDVSRAYRIHSFVISDIFVFLGEELRDRIGTHVRQRINVREILYSREFEDMYARNADYAPQLTRILEHAIAHDQSMAAVCEITRFLLYNEMREASTLRDECPVARAMDWGRVWNALRARELRTVARSRWYSTLHRHLGMLCEFANSN